MIFVLKRPCYTLYTQNGTRLKKGRNCLLLEKSLKWMLLTLAVFAALLAGVLLIVRAVSPPAPSPAQEQHPVAAVTDVPVQAEATPVLSPSPPPSAAPMSEEDYLRAYIEGMPLEDKLGQLVMFGFSGVTEPGDEFVSMLERYHIGNIVLYGANVNRTAEDGGFGEAQQLTERLSRLNPTGIPFLISIDIEGGRVQRFKWPSAPVSGNTIGKKNDSDLAYRQFYDVGVALRGVGINMNLAPVLDVSQDPMQTFLTTRIISSDAQIAADMGRSIIAGLNDAACLSTAKHFPGHGGTTEDTHATTPVITKSLDELERYELIPFRAGVEAGVDAVLVAHILYSQLDGEHIASMSERIITDLLRDELGFSGVVMSDDFRMGGLSTRYDVGDAAVRFLLAGGDLILCGPRSDLQQRIMTALTEAAENGTLSMDRINESVLRILQKKMKVTDWSPIPTEG